MSECDDEHLQNDRKVKTKNGKKIEVEEDRNGQESWRMQTGKNTQYSGKEKP